MYKNLIKLTQSTHIYFLLITIILNKSLLRSAFQKHFFYHHIAYKESKFDGYRVSQSTPRNHATSYIECI